ncbi:hypothetical protein JZ751_027190 [Albula glossodonta]|uniref:La-related protein 6 n=1 Tax=Albula glossodonta TaxID=121402 RepID=A0A8T2NNR3_9TELE|nr:hypothetical protein JZ751_027190 [Albula glossodonta]
MKCGLSAEAGQENTPALKPCDQEAHGNHCNSGATVSRLVPRASPHARQLTFQPFNQSDIMEDDKPVCQRQLRHSAVEPTAGSSVQRSTASTIVTNNTAFCWWVGDECGKTAWPNPRAPFKGTKPPTDQEVRTQDPSTSSTSPTPSCVSLAASSTPPQGSPWGRIGELWQAVERNFWALFAIQRRWCQEIRLPHSPCSLSPCTVTEKSYAVAETERGVIIFEEERDNEVKREALVPDSMSSAMELPSSFESMSNSAGLGGDGAVTDRQVQEMGTQQVTITVAIQAAEDEEPSEVLPSNHLDFHGGSCSEDDFGRHDKSRPGHVSVKVNRVHSRWRGLGCWVDAGWLVGWERHSVEVLGAARITVLYPGIWGKTSGMSVPVFFGAGTSGGELEEESWQPPDPELTQKLVAQIEYYLSDDNLEHDAFLLKHVRRNKMGFVSVKLLTSFKKVKHLTRDWRTTAYALRQSTLLELNEEGRKVRRRTLVPVFASESQPSRMLLLSDLQHWPELGGGASKAAAGGGAGDAGAGPESSSVSSSNGGGAAQQEHLMEVLLKAFGTFGSIASVRVLKPGKDLPPDLKKLSGRYAQLGAEECAIVEFEEVEAAIRAHEAMGGEAGEGCGGGGGATKGLKVVLIGTKPPKKKVPKERQRGEEAGLVVAGGGMRKSRSLNSRVRELQYLGDDSACSSSETESNPTSPRLARKSRSSNKLSPTGGGGASAYQQNNHLSPAVSPRSSPWSSPRASPCSQRKSPHIPNKSPLASEGRLSPDLGRRWADYSSDSSLTPSGSPWVQRRRQVASQENSPVGSPMLGRKIQNADGLPPGVVRLPRGPDGTRGFHCATMGQRATARSTTQPLYPQSHYNRGGKSQNLLTRHHVQVWSCTATLRSAITLQHCAGLELRSHAPGCHCSAALCSRGAKLQSW